MSKTTIGRSLETLEEKGYLIRNASPVSIFANVFELNIECPEGCKDFEIHYTQTEKKLRQSGSLLESGSILSKSGSILTTHIENYKEKEILETKSVFFGQEELGILWQLLDEQKQLTPEQIKVQEFAKTYPQEMATLLAEMVERNQVSNRKGYLKELLTRTPANLIRPFEKKTASEVGNNLITSSFSKTGKQETETSASSGDKYKPAHTPTRLENWFEQLRKDYPGLVPEEIFGDEHTNPRTWETYRQVSYYVSDLAYAGKLTTRHLVYDLLAKDFLAQKFGLSEGFSIERFPNGRGGPIRIQADLETGFPCLTSHSLPYWLTDDLELVYQTPEEKKYLLELNEAMDTARGDFLLFRPEADQTEWLRSEQRGKVLLAHPDPLTKEQKGERFLKILNEAIANTFRDFESREQPAIEISYADYLSRYSIQDDMKMLLEYIPERPEGHGKHLRAFEKVYREALASLGWSKVFYSVSCAELGFSEDKKYHKTPDKYLSEVIEQELEYQRLRESAI